MPPSHADVGAKTQVPEPGLQLSTVHGSLSLHATGLDPTHTPLLQVSTVVHESPSVQAPPWLVVVERQPPSTGLQASSVQLLLSLQI